jgi:hypothetical protein
MLPEFILQNQKVLLYRLQNGSAIAEFGPAIWLTMLCFFLPLLEIVSLLSTYACCMALNILQAEQAAICPKSQCDAIVKNQIPSQWQSSGLGIFAKCSSQPQTQVNYQLNQASPSPTGAAEGPQGTVCVSTTFQVSPFIQLPFLPSTFNFTISSQRCLEDPNGFYD